MNSVSFGLRRETLCGLALLFSFLASADDGIPRGKDYVLVTYPDGSRRLLIHSDSEPGSDTMVATSDRYSVDEDRQQALTLIASTDARDRTRGVTLLSGESDQASLDAVLVLLNDPSERVRVEAADFVADHPLTDDSIRALYAEPDED